MITVLRIDKAYKLWTLWKIRFNKFTKTLKRFFITDGSSLSMILHIYLLPASAKSRLSVNSLLAFNRPNELKHTLFIADLSQAFKHLENDLSRKWGVVGLIIRKLQGTTTFRIKLFTAFFNFLHFFVYISKTWYINISSKHIHFNLKFIFS